MLDLTKSYKEMNDIEIGQMWDSVADYLATPEDERKPKTNKEVYEALEIPERTFYYKLRQKEFMDLVVKKCLIQQKKFMPKVMAMLQKNVTDGKEKSIEMFLKYVAGLADRIDHTTKGESITPSSTKLDSLLSTLEDKNKESYERPEPQE